MNVKYINSLIEKFVKSDKYIISRDGHIYRKLDNVEIGYIKNNGYKAVAVIDDKGKCKELQIHRIIWYVYGSSPLSETLVLNHKDGNKQNNCIDNLEQVTIGENNLHRFKVLKYPGVIGYSKITKEIADEMRKLYNEGWTYKMLMNKYSVSKTTVSYVINNKIWM